MPKKPATPEPSPPSWAERVAAIMERYHLTQAGLGKRVGFGQSAVSKWLRQEQEPPISVRKLLVLMEQGNDLADLESAE